ncbi:hypothetical protein BDP27DRAFT_1452809 [Rhodocollybia butyracea]|uniref:Uncharacterized protein n=1 Tax=Rhodocollybia butyracea TaxID=206335 RepID=A0A9P5P7H1_9AGAR|nr:hypothetical protein BDP27DRAFT_1452809 [Rhodocollybia butyracea]
MQLSKMRSILLLFTIIAGSMLAVCPMPVPGGTPEPSSKRVKHSHGDSSIAQSSPPATSDSFHDETDATIRGVVLTFVDQTGQEMVSDKEAENYKASVTRVIAQTTGRGGFGKIDYRASYAPLTDAQGLKWVYFLLEGLSKHSTKERPCVGWIVQIDPKPKESKQETNDDKPKKAPPPKYHCAINKPGGPPWIPVEVSEFAGERRKAWMPPRDDEIKKRESFQAQFTSDFEYKPSHPVEKGKIAIPRVDPKWAQLATSATVKHLPVEDAAGSRVFNKAGEDPPPALATKKDPMAISHILGNGDNRR